MTEKLPSSAVQNLAAQLATVRGRAASQLKQEAMRAYGCSPSTLSRALNEIGHRSHSRVDAGRRRKAVTDEQLRTVAYLQASSTSLRKGIMMPGKDAIDLAEQNGILERGSVDPSYLNRWLRDNDGSRTDQALTTPHIELRSLGPNHVHQVDFSQAINWKIENNKLMYEHLIYQNKLPAAGVPRLWRLLVVDHTTGAFFPHYTAAAGETVPALLEGLYRAWTVKRIAGLSVEDRYPFKGVPQILMADRGSTTRSGITVSLLQKLGVTLNICEGARSKGTVETSHRWWEERFESRFRLQPPPSIEQLNDWAVDFAARYCAEEQHSRHGLTRSSLWQWHIQRCGYFRDLKCDFETFKSIALTDPQACKVDGARIIRFKGHKYRAPQEFVPGQFVGVQYSPFAYPEILMRDVNQPAGPAFAAAPIETDEFGYSKGAAIIGQEYKSQPHTRANTFAADARRGSKELVATGGIQAFGYHIDKVAPMGMKQTGEEVAVTPAQQTLFSRVEARAAVMETLGRNFTVAEAEFVTARFGEQVTEEQISAAVAEIQQQGVTGRVLSFPSAVGGSK